MLELSRSVRFYLTGDGRTGVAAGGAPGHRNGYAGWPGPKGLAGFFELRVTCRGRADAVTGYFINIKHIDQAVRSYGLPTIDRLVEQAGDPTRVAMGGLLRAVLHALQPPLDHTVTSVCLQLSPYHSLTVEKPNMSQVTLRQQYEFSAAHRLHVSQLSDERNREIFGKCNNPSGHGHNYQLEVAVTGDIDEQGGILGVDALDRVVHEHVLTAMDHKHLNVDVPAFANLNPSVENIARVIYDLLVEPVGELNVTLCEVSVWETPKTVCTYRGPAIRQPAAHDQTPTADVTP